MINLQVSNWNTIVSSSLCVSAIVILLKYNAVLGDTAELDVGVRHTVYQASSSDIGLYADAVSAVSDGAVSDLNVLDCVVVASSDRAD